MSGPDGHWPTPEPPHRVNQTFLEPVLFEHAAALPQITILNRSEVEGFEQGMMKSLRPYAIST
ncbi:MAG TPA: hypothetical protein VG758_02630 [Hyphomicrobiaceae bacterium]|jgi:hypothetical protein|nr:hypothetical protein [Hyphomicrobiaceae bacterium]